MATLADSKSNPTKRSKSKHKYKSKPKVSAAQISQSFNCKYDKNRKRKTVHFAISTGKSPIDHAYEEKENSIRKKRKKPRKTRRKSHLPIIKKEDRALRTWTKMEIAEWLQLNWYKNSSTHQQTSNLLSHINKIKREKKFNGQNIETLNNRRIIILAQRQLGLKKGETDFQIFIKRIHELQSKYSSKYSSKKHKASASINDTSRNNRKKRIKNKARRSRSKSLPYKAKKYKSDVLNNKRNKKKHNLSNSKNIKSKSETPKTKTRKRSLMRKKKKYKKRVHKSKSIAHLAPKSCPSVTFGIERSYTSPAISDVDKYTNQCGVTDDELLTLFSYGHSDEIDTDYDADTNYDIVYMTPSPNCVTPSPKHYFDSGMNVIGNGKFAYLDGDNHILDIPKHNGKGCSNKTTVVPSILSLSDMDSGTKSMDICLSPIVGRDSLRGSENMAGFVLDTMYYMISDEETDDEQYKNVKDMVNDITNGILF